MSVLNSRKKPLRYDLLSGFLNCFDYFADLGLKKAEDCQTCPAGYYCSQAGANTTSGLCASGYYCPSGSVREQQVPCPEGKYCPRGSEDPELCPVGTYQPNKRQDDVNDCLPCTEGMSI